MIVGVQRISQQICFHLLQTLPKLQQQRLAGRLQELNQRSQDLTSLTESTTEEQTTSTLTRCSEPTYGTLSNSSIHEILPHQPDIKAYVASGIDSYIALVNDYRLLL